MFIKIRDALFNFDLVQAFFINTTRRDNLTIMYTNDRVTHIPFNTIEGAKEEFDRVEDILMGRHFNAKNANDY